MRFSEVFNVQANDYDWFDPVLSEDTPLYVDPFLVFEDEGELWQDSHDLVVSFFDTCLGLIQQAEGRPESAHWAKALRLLTFPEPKELALGMAMGTPVGSGTSAHFARQMADALHIIARAVHHKVPYVDAFALFVPGLGVDRISDIFCNILKSRLIAYTEQVCQRHDVAVELITVRHARWDAAGGRWIDTRLRLPRSPVTGQAVLLTPERFLQDIPQRVTPGGLWSWAEVNVNTVLRQDLNYDLSQSLTPAEKASAGRDLAHRRPKIAFDYVDTIAEADHRPYDVRSDPQLLVGWFETGRAAARHLLEEGRSPPAQPTESGFEGWVDTLIGELKHAVEDTDLWRALWDDDLRKPRAEKIVQAIAGALLSPYCRAADVDITREANIGRGPVDFKFSAGWTRRTLLEVKLMSSRKLQRGAAAQLPQYMRSEKITCGYYVCVGYTDDELADDRKALVGETCAALTEAAGWKIVPRFIDARPKESASKL